MEGSSQAVAGGGEQEQGEMYMALNLIKSIFNGHQHTSKYVPYFLISVFN